MSFALAPAAILALLASLPSAKADTICQLDRFGNQECFDEGKGYLIRVIIGSALIGLFLLTVAIFGFLRFRRRKQVAASSAFAGVPVVGYEQGPQNWQRLNWQGQSAGSGAVTNPPTYDSNVPPPAFNGYQWQGKPNVLNAPPQYPTPTYAPPAGSPPENEKETV